MLETMLGVVNEETLRRLSGPFQDFGEKLNSANGLEWEEAFKKFLRKELSWACPVCNPFRETGEVSILIPALPRPTLAELQAKFPWIKSIEADTSPTEAVTLKFATVLRPEETNAINGAEYERRLTPKFDGTILGYQQAIWLVEHQNEFPELKPFLGKIYIDFTALIVVGADGGRFYPCLLQDDERWDLDWYWLDDDFASHGRVAAGK